MKLIVHELEASGLVQELTATKTTNIYAVRPHIYRHNFPTGSLKMQILDTSDNLIGESAEVTIASIGSADFFHGYVRFLFSCGVTKDTSYKFKLVSTGGYSFNESAYIGWCNGYDLGKYDTTYTTSIINTPLDLEVWERKP
jgi:hypothetical protein